MARGISANLDFLRAFAVLLVVTQHICRRLQINQVSWIPTSSLGYFGVLLFFVHTSLVLMYSLERSSLTGSPLIGTFYLRRILRIYPLSIIIVLTALALHLDSDVNGVSGLSRGELPGKVSMIAQLLLVQNLVHVKSIVNVLWSLPFELQMYLFLPFLFLWAGGKRMFWPVLGLWAASLVPALVQPRVAALSRLSILIFIPSFLPGVVAYTLPRVPRLHSFLWPLFVLSLAAVFTLRPVLHLGWVLGLVLGLLIPSFAELTTPWLCVVCNRIATYSYGIYVSHQFSIWIAFGVLQFQSLWLRTTVLIALLVGLPVLLYHAVEKPMIDVGVRITTKRAACEVATPPATDQSSQASDALSPIDRIL
jgi:peptidoglycan/LPS O-acetylase OafA/YrhL